MANRIRIRIGAALMVALASTAIASIPSEASGQETGSAVVIANRGSGDLTVIDTSTLDAVTVDLPGEAEPMYVNHDARNGRVLVGDRASNTIFALDDSTYDLIDSVPVEPGVAHQWYDPTQGQLWVVSDITSTVAVLAARDLSHVARIKMPRDLVSQGGRPHDVTVAGQYAFVTMAGFDDGSTVVLRYSTGSHSLTGRILDEGGAHVYAHSSDLYVADQAAGEIRRFDPVDLTVDASTQVAAAHGLSIGPEGDLLVTNIAGGGTGGVVMSNTALEPRDTIDTPFGTPHNVTVDASGQAWVTHSGPTATQVSVINMRNHAFTTMKTVEAGTNPFGLAVVAATPAIASSAGSAPDAPVPQFAG